MAKKRLAGASQVRTISLTEGKQRKGKATGSGIVLSRNAGLALLMLLATLVAYGPALRGQLLWDDAAHVTKPELQSLHGLWRIWFELGATQQYYPLLHSAFWFEHRVWGDAVMGYHLANVVLHAASAFLLVLIVQRLALPGAWLAGLVFALHPVCVEAVAWISEQKSTLSGVLYLGSALTYLHFDQTRRKSKYCLAFGLFVLALLSKTVTATLPAVLLVIFWWRRGRIDRRRDLLPLLPWFVLGITAGLFTAWVERKFIGAEGAAYGLTLTGRFLLAGRVVWFYLGKLLWPADLVFTYPHWTIDPAVWWQYLFPVAVLALAIGLCVVARRHRGPLAGFLIFAGTLFPVLGFLNVYPFRYSYVADHFQYLAGLGVIVPAASALTLAARRFSLSRSRERAAGALLLAVLAVLTWRQSSMYRNDEILYRTTLARNPGSWMAHNNLGVTLSQIPGRLPEAVAEHEASLRLNPNNAEAYYDLGNVLMRMPGRQGDAVAAYQAALRIKPDYVEARSNLGSALLHMPGRLPEAIAEYEAVLRTQPDNVEIRNNLGSALMQIPGRLQDAIAQYEAAVRIKPDYAQAHFNLGGAFSQTPARLPAAIAEYEAALRIQPDYVEAHFNLANALAQTGRLPDALAHYAAALRIRPDFEPARRMLEQLRPAQR